MAQHFQNELVEGIDKPLSISNRLLAQFEGLGGLNFYLINFARLAMRDIHIGGNGQRLYNHCLNNLPIIRSADSRLQMGWSEQHLLRNAGVNLFEYEHLLLASAFSEYLSEPYAAAVYNELAARYEDDDRPKPSLNSFRIFVQSANGIMATSDFPCVVDDRIRLNPYRQPEDGLLFARQPQETLCATKLAEALVSLNGRGVETSELVIAGGDVSGWFAAYAEICLGIDVTLEDEDGHELWRANAGSGRRLRLRFVRLESTPTPDVHIWLRNTDVTHTTPTSLGRVLIHSGRVLPDAIFTKVFGSAFHRLAHAESKTFANALGGLARVWELLVADDDISPDVMNPDNKSNTASWGLGLITTWSTWFPELRHLSGRMERLVMLGLALSRVALIPNLFMSRAGLISMYNSQVRKRSELKKGNIDRHGWQRHILLFGEDWNSTFPKRILNALAMFAGSWPGNMDQIPENLIGMSHEGIAAYSMMLEKGNKNGRRSKDDQVLRVVTGSVCWKQRALRKVCLGKPVYREGVHTNEQWEKIECEHLSEPLALPSKMMRLQVAIFRHTLPPTNIVFATGVGPCSHTSKSSATIFNLLEDLNDIVPLESSDGEWGLEDYVVEVAATADQEKSYECLHYLPLKSVLREDDEIVVRPLGNDDLRLWRRGGRMQITADGRHLIDGVVFSKPWVRKDSTRPGVTIPPQKKRRLLEDDEESQKENVEPLQQLLPLVAPSNEEDSEADTDYNEEIADGDIVVRDIFEDADSAEEELSDVDGQEIQLLLQDAAEVASSQDANGTLESRLRTRTRLGKRKRRSSDEVSQSDEEPFEGFESPEKTRALRDVSGHFKSVEDDESSQADGLLNEIAEAQLFREEKNLVNDEEEDASSDEDFSSEATSSESTSDSEEDSRQRDVAHSPRSAVSEEDSGSDAGSTSDASDKTSDDDDDDDDISTSSSDSDSAGTSSASSAPNVKATKVTGATSRSVVMIYRPRMKALQDPASASRPRPANSQHQVKVCIELGRTTPGPSSSTVAEDLEAARKRALSILTIEAPAAPAEVNDVIAPSIEPDDVLMKDDEQESPEIPETQPGGNENRDALPLHVQPIPEDVFAQWLALNDHERACKWLKYCFESSSTGSVGQVSLYVGYQRCFKEHRLLPGSALLLSVREVFSNAHVVDPYDPDTAIRGITPKPVADESDGPTARPTGEAATLHDEAPTPALPAVPSPKAESAPTSSPRNVDASAVRRRMIFGSLGLPSPKTPAQAKALQDKLAASARRPTSRPKPATDESKTETASASEVIDWQDKLIVSAVECEKDGVTYPPPPFPFKQFWYKSNSGQQDDHEQSERLQQSLSQSNDGDQSASVSRAHATSRSPSKNHSEEPSTAESRTVSFEKDDRDGMPMPTDFSALTDLNPSQLLPGAIIAFKQLDVDFANGFGPKMSEYKIARISKANGDNIQLILAVRDRLTAPPSDDDENRMSQFIIDAGGEDDGVRDIDFSDLLEAKLIAPSSVQVAASHDDLAHERGKPITDTQNQPSLAVSESVLPPVSEVGTSLPVPANPVTVSTPRRHEITAMMHEDGFDSAVGEYVLKPDISSQAKGLDSSQHEGVTDASNGPIQDDDLDAQDAVSSSSPFFPGEDHDGSSKGANGTDHVSSDAPMASSSPPISPQLTVDYPSISRFELNSDLPEQIRASGHSSSHPDAQHVSPIPEADITLIPSVQDGHIDIISESNSMAHDGSEPEDGSNNAASTPASFLGRQLDGGQDSSFQVSDEDDGSFDSDGSLPSLRDLSSSQKRKIMTRATKVTREVLPPEPTRRSTRSSSGSKAYKQSLAGQIDGVDDSDEHELPPLKNGSIKLNGSGPRLSQVPPNTQFVDLTLSSDPVSAPDSDGDESSYKPNGHKRKQTVRKGRSARKVPSDSESEASFGIGTRKFLTSRKTRSLV
ncbi:uncharacterized protein AB675_7925 [Cyphellophora attinorum]|uniref:Uncharacterized protein n=1 Tax=Cyphellophora attinorum TaxID=1664694 RepID=A0A0N0NN92_9EURO|nr:uncharacterized protein AB675_7925 [Phialophora attinorum]KPI41099.1 hypothetical protein AB675_7925 [Phialophora attinorum]